MAQARQTKSTRKKEQRRPDRWILKPYFITVIVSIAIALLIRTFLIEAYQISSFSMSPSLLPGDFIFITKWNYSGPLKSTPQRGEIVVYTDALNTNFSKTHFISRIVGLPGDEVSLHKGVIFLNGKEWGEPMVFDNVDALIEDFGPEKVSENSVFLIGDSRVLPESKKRKGWDIIPFSSLEGKALLIWLSVEQGEPGFRQTHSSWMPRIRKERVFRRLF